MNALERHESEDDHVQRAHGPLFAAAPVALFVVGGDGEVVACNDAAVRALGPECRGGRVSPWPPQPEGADPAHGRLSWPTRTGAEHVVALQLRPLETGQPGRWVAAPSAPEELARAQGDAAFLAGILHNVGNSLNGVGVVSRALMAGLDELPVEALSRLAQHLTDHADDLPGFFAANAQARLLPEFVRSLADRLADRALVLRSEVARLDHRVDHVRGTIQTQQLVARGRGARDVRLSDAIALAVAFEEDAYTREDIALDVVLHDALPVLALEEHVVVQILLNLLSNARHAVVGRRAAAPGAGVVVEARADAREVRVTVTDSGVGIAAERLPHLFAVGATTRSDGNGVGLAISAHLAATLGGRLDVASAGVGRGASFSLVLPLDHATDDTCEVSR